MKMNKLSKRARIHMMFLKHGNSRDARGFRRYKTKSLFSILEQNILPRIIKCCSNCGVPVFPRAHPKKNTFCTLECFNKSDFYIKNRKNFSFILRKETQNVNKLTKLHTDKKLDVQKKNKDISNWLAEQIKQSLKEK